jgi:hypothetical protein
VPPRGGVRPASPRSCGPGRSPAPACSSTAGPLGHLAWALRLRPRPRSSSSAVVDIVAGRKSGPDVRRGEMFLVSAAGFASRAPA